MCPRPGSGADVPTTLVPVDWKGLSAVTLLDAGVKRCDRWGRPLIDGSCVRVPYRLPGGAEHNAKVFGPAGHVPRCWWQWKGRDQVPFGLERLAAGFGQARASVIITEGESCCLAVRDRYAVDVAGRRIVVVGLPGAGSWVRRWTAYFLAAHRVYVAGDGDAAGRRMMDSVLADLQEARPVILPEGEDSRSILQGATPGLYDELLAAADDAAVAFDRMRVAA